MSVTECMSINGVSSPGPGVPPVVPNFILGQSAIINAFNLPDPGQVAAAASPYDCTAVAGTVSAPVALTFCGNADSTGDPYTQAEALALSAQICDMDPTLVKLPIAVNGAITNATANNAVPTRSGFGAGGPGIGAAGAQCIPVSFAAISAGNAVPCNIAVADVDLGTQTGGQFFVGTAGLVPKPSPTLTITSVTGQLAGAQAAREGNVLNVSGTSFDAPGGVGTLTAQLCDAATALVCNAASSANLTLTPDGTGLSNLSGSVTVPALATPGARVLKITQTSDGQAAKAAIEILGARAIALSDASGGLGATITITGSGFDALQAVTVLASTGNPADPPLTVGSGSVNNKGQVSGSIVINNANTTTIVVAENDAPTTQLAFAPFVFSADKVTCDASTATNDCVLTQTISQEVIGVALVFEQVDGNVTMSAVTLDGVPHVSSGTLSDLTITNSRGDDAPWEVQGVLLGDFVEGTPASNCAVELNHCIPADNLGWVPSAEIDHLQINGDVAAVTAGDRLVAADPTDVEEATQPWIDGEGLGTSRSLCSADQYESGGTFGCDAALYLGVPASATAGTYKAKLQLTLT